MSSNAKSSPYQGWARVIRILCPTSRGFYGLSVLNTAIGSITDKLIPEIKQWQRHPLESHYPFIWLDTIHHKVREYGCYGSKAVYTLPGLNLVVSNIFRTFSQRCSSG